MGRYSKYQRKYVSSWEQMTWAKGWLKKTTDGNISVEKEAYCTVCKSAMRAHKGDLQKHALTAQHLKNVKRLNVPSANRITKHMAINITNEEKERDIRISAFIAAHSAIRTVDHLTNMLKVLGKSSQSVFHNMKMHRTKTTCIIKNVIAPSHQQELIDDIKESPFFSLIVDESTDISVIKYLCVCVKYFSRSRNVISSDFLGLIQIERATAQDLFNEVNIFLQKIGLDIKNMIGIGTDGANNLCGQKSSLFALLRKENPKIQLVRCICHSLDNCASSAVKELPACVDFLCREVYDWFSKSSLRRIEYQKLCDLLKDGEKPFHQFVQLSTTRWLCRFNAVNVLLENWEDLKEHFKIVVNKEKCYMARVLNDMLQDDTNLLLLKIVKPIIFEINKTNIIFQKNDVELGSAHTDLGNLVLFLAKKILKPQFSDDLDKILNVFSNDFTIPFLAPQDCDFGIEYYKTLSKVKISPEQKTSVETKSFNYLKCLIKELVKRLPDYLKHFKKLEYFSPQKCLSQGTRQGFKHLPFTDIYVDPSDLFKMESEYNNIINVNWVELYGEDVIKKSSTFWPIVHQHKDAGGNSAFPILSKFVLLILALPMSNALVERVFSIMNNTKTKIRNRMSIALLQAILTIKSNFFSKKCCCDDFVITKDMYQRLNANIYKTVENNETVDLESEELEYELFDLELNVPVLRIE